MVIKMKRKVMLVVFFALAVAMLYPTNSMKAAKKAKPNLTVPYKKVSVRGAKMEIGADGSVKYKMAVKNKAKKGTIRKIVYTYSITRKKKVTNEVVSGSATVLVEETVTVPATVKIVAKNIKPGKTSKVVSCEGDCSGQVSNMKLKQVKLYAGTGLYTYDVEKKKGTLSWGTKDKKAPVLSGMLKQYSYNGKSPHMVCYTDKKNSFDFTRFVTAFDKRDGKVKVEVDTSKINWKKDGVYKVRYIAKDKAGNKTTSWAKIQVYKPGTAEQIADQVLKQITKKSWSAEKKARAIYNYVKKRCSYVDNGSHGDWRKAAVSGIRYQSGDCFTYYAVVRLLLSRAGIPNMEVTRYPSYEGYRHWWSLVYVRNGWYHLDTTPRKRKGEFCLLTDSQVWGYSKKTFAFRTSIFLPRAKKQISKSPVPKS